MNVEQIREHALSLPATEECFPFGEDTMVYKAYGKIYLLVSLSDIPLQFNVKCDPELAIELRMSHACVQPGYHMNKKHWNTVIVDNTLPDKDLLGFIDHSYSLVAKKKKK